MKDIIIGGIYQHYKGKDYRVIGLAKHSETLEELVVYEALYDNKESQLWVRPKKMFLENVKIDGKIRPRFQYLGDLDKRLGNNNFFNFRISQK